MVEVKVRCEDGQWEAQTRAACRVDWQRGTTQWSQGLLDLEGGNRIWNVADCIPHWAWQIDTDHPDDIDTAIVVRRNRVIRDKNQIVEAIAVDIHHDKVIGAQIRDTVRLTGDKWAQCILVPVAQFVLVVADYPVS